MLILTAYQRQIVYLLITITLVIWLILFVILLPRPVNLINQVVAAPLSSPTPTETRALTTPQKPRLIFDPTWTSTTSPTPTSTATRIPTFTPGPSPTPSATFPVFFILTPPSPTYPASINGNYDHLFKKIAPKYKLSWQLMRAQAKIESGLNPYAVGRDNDRGLMQIIPSTWNQFAPQVEATNPFDPEENITVAAVYLSYVRGRCRSGGYAELGCMLLAYNWGPNNTLRLYETCGTWRCAPARQQRYVGDILRTAGY